MALIDEIINVLIRIAASGPSRVNFGTMLIAVQHALTSRPLVEAFGSLSEAEAAGHVSPSPAYKALAVAFSQSPRPKQIKVGRRAQRAQVIRISAVTPSPTPVNGVVYSGEIDGEAWTYTVSGSVNLAAQMTAIASAINALAVAVTADGSSGTYVSVTSASGVTHTFETTAQPDVMQMLDAGGDTNVNTDLSAFQAYDPDWYGFTIDTSSEADVTDAATWAESQVKICALRTHDAGVAVQATTTDVASDLVALDFLRTTLQWSRIIGNLIDVALLANRSTANPGSDTWAYKQLRGVVTDTDLTTAETNTLEAKRANFYTTVKGQTLTLWGKTPSGENISVIRGSDWQTDDIQTRVLGVFLANEKVDFDNGGIELFAAEVRASLAEGVRRKFLKADPEPVVNTPDEADISAGDKQDGLLEGLDFVAYLRDSVLKTRIVGTLTR